MQYVKSNIMSHGIQVLFYRMQTSMLFCFDWATRRAQTDDRCSSNRWHSMMHIFRTYILKTLIYRLHKVCNAGQKFGTQWYEEVVYPNCTHIACSDLQFLRAAAVRSKSKSCAIWNAAKEVLLVSLAAGKDCILLQLFLAPVTTVLLTDEFSFRLSSWWWWT